MSLVRTEIRDEIAVLTLDRPKANAFSPELVAELAANLTAQARARGVVLASALPGMFSAGWDLTLIVDHDPFLDFWFSEDARVRIRDMVARLSSRA